MLPVRFHENKPCIAAFDMLFIMREGIPSPTVIKCYLIVGDAFRLPFVVLNQANACKEKRTSNARYGLTTKKLSQRGRQTVVKMLKKR